MKQLILLSVILLTFNTSFAARTFTVSGDAAKGLIVALSGIIDITVPWNQNGTAVSCREQTFSDAPSVFHCSLIGEIQSASAGAHPYKRDPFSGELETRPSITFSGEAANVLVNKAAMHITGKSNMIECSKLESGAQSGHICTLYLIKDITTILVRPEPSDFTL